MNRPRLRAALLLASVFLLGGGTGAGIAYVVMVHQQRGEQSFDFGRRGDLRLSALTHTLDLTSEQARRVGEILARQAPARRQAMQRIMGDCGAPLREHKQRIDREIRTLLDERQQKIFDELAARQEERLFLPKGGRRRGGGPHRGGFGAP